MNTRTFSLITLVAVGLLCIGAARADQADELFGGIEQITIGDAGPKAHAGATATLHAVRVSEEQVLLLWEQRGKQTYILQVAAPAVPHLAPVQVGRTRTFFALVEGKGKAKQWVAIELVPEGAR